MFNKNITLLLCACALLCTQSITANVVWSAMFIHYAIEKLWFLTGISMLIEAAVFYFYLKNDYRDPAEAILKAFLMSLTGNIASWLIGFALAGLFAGLAAFLLVILTRSLAIPYNLAVIIDWAINGIAMYFFSVLIELLVIKLVFKYPAKKLWVPILIGNLITYALIPVFYYLILQKPLPHFH